MCKVMAPAAMNEAFARAFNRRDGDALLALYEPGAVLRTGDAGPAAEGIAAIGRELAALLRIPGTMVSVNRFCIEHDGIALLRADWRLVGPDGAAVVAGSSAEVVRRQDDGSWLYVIDHAVGAGLPRAD